MNRSLFQHVRRAWVALALTIMCSLLATGAIIVQMILLSKVVNRVFLLHNSLVQVELFLLLLLAVIAVRAGLTWVREMTAQEAASRVKTELRLRLFAQLLRLGPAYSKGESTGELVTTACEGIERLDAYVSRYLPQVVLSALIPLLIAGSIFPLDWTSALMLLVTGPIIPLLMVLIGSYAEQHVQHQWVALARMGAQFLDAVQGLPTLKLFGRSEAIQKRIAVISDRFREKTLKMLRIAFLSGMVLEFMAAVAIGLVAVTLGIRLLNGGISFESAFLVLLLAPEFYRPLRELGVQRHAGMEGKAAAKRISEILDIKSEVETPILTYDEEISVKRPINQLTITLSNVTYTYPGSERPAVKDVSLTLPYGTCTALVGRSGSGKSTLVNLLLRFMDAQDGQIAVNGIPIHELPVEMWREYIALVPQKPYLFYGSVRENICMARPNASDNEIMQATEFAGAATFINQLPQGYETEIGERGLRLSAGQAQRIAIARAFLKDAPLLVLDEPTSSLDPESELLIRRAMEKLMCERTVLVIAHRYNTIANAGQIAVMQDGALVEVDTPAELLQRNGVYSQLMEMYGKV